MDAISEREDFQRKFVAALARSPPALWYEIWVLLWEDPWFQSELTKQARFLLSARGKPSDWLPDVRHDAMVNLAAKLRNTPTLDVNPDQPINEFSSFITVVIRNASRQAIKRLRRIYCSGQELVEESELRAAWTRFESDEQSQELNTAVDDLPEPLCSALRFYRAGETVDTISRRMQLSYWVAYRALRQGIEQVRQDLRSP